VTRGLHCLYFPAHNTFLHEVSIIHNTSSHKENALHNTSPHEMSVLQVAFAMVHTQVVMFLVAVVVKLMAK
jgi:hypothetical protein